MRRSPHLSTFVTAVAALLLWIAPSARLTSAQLLSFSGFVKAENIYDTRQVFNIREGQFHLFPLAGEANEQDNLIFAAFQTRLNLASSGTRALGADVTAMVEGDFFGSSNDGISQFFLRHAFARMVWEDREVLFGQFWSPMFVPEVVPQVVAFNTGAPFNPFARYPQVTFIYRPSSLRFLGSVTQQRDAFSEIGGAKLHQQAALPAAHAHLQWAETGRFFGAGVTAKAIRPTLNSERVTAGAATAYAGISGPGIIFRGKATYGANLADHLMLGGFVTDISGDFRPLHLLSGWIDLMTPGDLSYGIFLGYQTNLGASEDVRVVSVNARAPNIDYLWRASPRIWYNARRMRFAFETEVTSARYASAFDNRHRPRSQDADDAVTNVRFHFSTYYFF
jgi:hypothetical protein